MTGLPVTAGGMLSDPEQVNQMIRNNKADMIYLGRELLKNPYWPLQAAKKLNYDIEWPKQYERAKPK